MGTYPLRVRLDLGVGPRVNSRRALAPWAPANQQSSGGVGDSTRREQYRPGRSLLSPLGRIDMCMGMDGFRIPGDTLMLPWFDGTSTLSLGATLAARLFHDPQPINIRFVEWGFYTTRGGIDAGDFFFYPRVVRVVEVWRYFSFGDGNFFFPGAAGPRRWPEGQLSPRTGSMGPSQSVITRKGWAFHTARVVPTWAIFAFVPGSEL